MKSSSGKALTIRDARLLDDDDDDGEGDGSGEETARSNEDEAEGETSSLRSGMPSSSSCRSSSGKRHLRS